MLTEYIAVCVKGAVWRTSCISFVTRLTTIIRILNVKKVTFFDVVSSLTNTLHLRFKSSVALYIENQFDQYLFMLS